jgi:hypothetical protein
MSKGVFVIKILAVDDDPHLLETIVIQIEEEGAMKLRGRPLLRRRA